MDEKLCGKCQRVLSISCFGVDKQTSNGYKNNCKECRSVRAKKFYQDNVEKIKEKTSEYQAANPEVRRRKVQKYRNTNPNYTLVASRSRYNRRLAMLNVDIIDDIDILVLGQRDSWICQLCFNPVDPGLGGTTSLSRSIDHIIPVSLGGEHSYKNTQLAHFGCNAGKCARTVYVSKNAESLSREVPLLITEAPVK